MFDNSEYNFNIIMMKNYEIYYGAFQYWQNDGTGGHVLHIVFYINCLIHVDLRRKCYGWCERPLAKIAHLHSIPLLFITFTILSDAHNGTKIVI